MLDIYAARERRKRMLVICPKTLMVSAWASDIEKFTPYLTFSMAYAENRQEAFDLDTDIVIINTDGVKWLAKPENLGYCKQFDHLVIDEASAYKHHTSQRSKAAIRIKRFFTHRYLMTGTPNPNSVTELWNLARIVDDGARLGDSFFRFRNAIQQPTRIGPGEHHIRWDDKPGAAQTVQELLADITVRHAFEDVMSHVPPNHRDMKFFTLNRKTKALYDRLETDAILVLKDAVVNAVHAAALRIKLLQVASGAVYTEEGNYEVIDQQRYELITDLVEEREHSVVFFNWRHQRDQLSNAFKKRGIPFAVIDGSTPHGERDRIVTEYQAGKYQTLLLHPRTGAHGLTLTRGTTTIFSSPIYEADLLQQAVHRIYRGGQTHITNTILVCAKGTVEELVYARLDAKGAAMVDLLDLLNSKRRGQHGNSIAYVRV